MHKPLKSQADYIAGLVETRKATDIFAIETKTDPEPKVGVSGKRSFGGMLKRGLKSLLGGQPAEEAYHTTNVEAEKKKSPVVFCYSLFYVYYDQYTYITGVLAQDVMLGLVFIFVAIQ